MTFRDECHQEILFNKKIIFFFLGGTEEMKLFERCRITCKYLSSFPPPFPN
jgi:hypothetical protein